MSGLIRDPVKFVRDRAKSRYNKDTICAISGSTENLDFHHYYSLTPLFTIWARKNKYSIKTDDEVIAVRDQFIAEHEYELFEAAVTLTHEWHMRLHKVYGKAPSLVTAHKQMRWVEKQRVKWQASLSDG